MKKTIGILAHVDSGKTTFSEQLLYVNGSVRTLGAVNNGTSHLDTQAVERDRGITVFAGQASFEYGGNTYYFIDTPGHIDFSPETERVLCALDYAILLVSGTAGVQPHTATLFSLLERYNVPTFFFINKCDMENASSDRGISGINRRLTKNWLYIDSYSALYTEEIKEQLADIDEDFAELYLEEEDISDEVVFETICRLTAQRKCFPILKGSALSGESVAEFTKIFDMLTETGYNADGEFSAVVYKIRHEDGKRLTFMKALTGSAAVKDEFIFVSGEDIVGEKINEIRFYNGDRYTTAQTASAGDIFAVTGLTLAQCGDRIKGGAANEVKTAYFETTSALEAGVEILDGTDVHTVLNALMSYDMEEPSLSVRYSEETGEIVINTMGEIQLEVLERIVKERFGFSIAFKKPRIKYRETIAAPVMGYGHFEPLRHYAEVQLRLEPLGVGGGLEFNSECDREHLAESWHKLIKKHIYERPLPGILTGSPITDIRVVLTDGRAHLKHTSPGDFREATHRAVRQALEKAENVLLEPFYSFEIQVSADYAGRIMSDIQKMRGSFEAPSGNGSSVIIRGSAPVETLMDYPKELMSFTSGTAAISMRFDRYDRCGDEVAERVIAERAYNKGADKQNPSSSVFCSHGSSFVVEWYECEQYMHTLK